MSGMASLARSPPVSFINSSFPRLFFPELIFPQLNDPRKDTGGERGSGLPGPGSAQNVTFFTFRINSVIPLEDLPVPQASRRAGPGFPALKNGSPPAPR